MLASDAAEAAKFEIAQADLEELEVINEMILRAWETKKTDAMFALYQRIKQIVNRTRRTFED